MLVDNVLPYKVFGLEFLLADSALEHILFHVIDFIFAEVFVAFLLPVV